MTDGLEDRLRALRTPRAPGRLRAETIARAAAVGAPSIGFVDRLWYSRALRTAWAAGMIVVVVHGVVSSRSGIARTDRASVDLPVERRAYAPGGSAGRGPDDGRPTPGGSSAERHRLAAELTSGDPDLRPYVEKGLSFAGSNPAPWREALRATNHG